MGRQKILLAAKTLELAPAAAAGITIGPQIAQPRPTIIGTARRGTELLRGVHLARPSLCGGEQQWQGKRGWRARPLGLLTGGTAGFRGEPSKRLRLSGALLAGRGWRARCRAGRGAVS